MNVLSILVLQGENLCEELISAELSITYIHIHIKRGNKDIMYTKHTSGIWQRRCPGKKKT